MLTSAKGCSREDFKVNWEEEKVECPQGMTSYKWQTQKDKEDGPSYILARFRPKECVNCVAREQCTRNARLGRSLHIRPQSEYEALQERRSRQAEAEFKACLDLGAGIEGTLSGSAGIRVKAQPLYRQRFDPFTAYLDGSRTEFGTSVELVARSPACDQPDKPPKSSQAGCLNKPL